jgi:Zn-dependent protease with chaperone function
MAAVFDVTDFLHPLDMAARQQLERIPLLQAAVKKYLSVVTDRKVRQALLASALRLGPKQLPEIYRLLPPICDAFGIAEPELYLTRGGEANAMTVGHTRTAIVIYNQLLEDLAEDEIQAVLAHECGHILAEHILYRQMSHTMLRAGATAGGLGTPLFKAVAGLATHQIQTALIDWYRKSELTADRAAVAYLRDPEPMQRALFHIIGVPKWLPGEISYSEFLEQAAEFDQVTESSKWDRYLARSLESESTHPIPAVRIRELTVWAESSAFQQLLDIAKAGRMVERVGCSKCGQELAPDWRFCLRCGEPVRQAAVSKKGEEA